MDEMLSSSGRLMEIPFSASIEWIKQKPKQQGSLTLESALIPREVGTTSGKTPLEL